MMHLKKIFFIIEIFFFAVCLHAQSEQTEVNAVDSDSILTEEAFDELDSFFDEASDVDEAVTSALPDEKGTITIQTNVVSIPLHFSGHLESEVGIGYINEDGKNDATAGVEFLNDLTFSTRVDKTFAFKATLRTEFPDDDSESQWNFRLYEMYFDYVLLNSLYITAGKKDTSWGCIRLFSDTDAFEDDDDALCTDILNDSGEGTSLQLRLPFGNCMLTGFALYKGNGDTASYKDMSLAASLEMLLGYTSFNVFCRKYPDVNSTVVLAGKDVHKNPVVGAELKRTIFSFDVYAQELTILGDYTLLKDLGKKALVDSNQIHGDDLTGFSKMIFTGGLYRLWETKGPSFGFNAEYQDVYIPNISDHTSKMAFYGGISRLGKNKHVALAVTWKHVFQETCGEVNPGIVLTGIFPHATWKNGVKIEYGGDYDTAKITVGTTLRLLLDY